jgi:Rod binding domain-containing protein
MDPTAAITSQAPLTLAQQGQLKKLHDAATQLEGVFLGMMLKAMHPDDGSDQSSIFGPPDNAQTTWNEMLDEKRADAMAQTGQLGIAKMVEDQLRASVLGIMPGVPPTVEK